MTHSPTPWRVASINKTFILDANGSFVAQMQVPKNRDTIIHCVNSHEPLVKALEKAVADYGKPGGPWNVPSEPGTWIEMARKALAKAKEAVQP